MGITAKPTGKFRSILQKVENEKLKEQKALNHKKSKKSEDKEN